MKPEINDKQIIKAQDEMIEILSIELRRISKANLRLKNHLQILAGTPYCNTAATIREAAKKSDIFSETIINLN